MSRPWWRHICAATVTVMTFLMWLFPRLQGPGHHHRVAAFLVMSIGLAVTYTALNVAAVMVPVRVLARPVVAVLYRWYLPVLRFQLWFRRDWS
jgi:hypothetical protein